MKVVIKVTRKNALISAINVVKSSEIPEPQKDEIVNALHLCISELPFSHWTKDSVFDACNQYIEDHHCQLTLNCFASKSLPPHTVVRRLFGMTLKEFRDTYYPLQPMQQQTPDEIISEFKFEYLRCGAHDRKSYNNMRDKLKPCVATVLKRAHCKTWAELLNRAGIQQTMRQPKREPRTYNVTFHIHAYDIFKDENK